jgi:glycosyltransferase involved in cell wall biosynthesis
MSEKSKNMESSSSSDFRILLVGLLFPDWLEAKMLEQEILPIQTQRFGLALLDALRAGFDGNIEVLSSAPLLDYPHSRLLFAPSAKWRIDNKIKATMLPFLNLVILKHMTRFVATFAFVIQWVLRNKSSNLIIILHGVQSCKIWGVLLGQVLAPCITVSFLTDDIGIPLKWENTLLKKIRLVDVYLMKLGLQKISGIIAMTPNLAEKLAPGRPALIMPTIRNLTSNAVSNKIRNSNDDSFTIVYTGRLSHSYGIDLLLYTFKQANRNRPNWRLLITGWGEMENAVRDFAVNNRQVEYLGFLDSEGIAELHQLADVFVNPKLTSTSIASLAFPSKIVEYLGTGKPVVSTNLPIFDDGIRQHLIIAQSDSPEELIRCLDDVASWNDHQRESWRKQTLMFVNEELSPVIQGARIRGFIDSLKN